MERIVGIDLGTSTSCLACVKGGVPTVIPDSRGNRVTPSYIHVMEDGRILVGPQAKVEVISDPYSTIWATKRLIGRKYEDPEVQDAKKHFGYQILPADDGGVMVKGGGKELSPTEVAAIMLKYLTRIGKKNLGRDIKRAVVTVPAYFTDPQRKATRESGELIGLDIVRLVNEPTAAALAYGYDRDMEQTVAVYDFGGGTFDLSILAIGQGVFEVLATDGDSYLGGEDFDNRLVEFLVEDFKQKFGINIYNDKMAHQRVKDAAERTKMALSRKESAEMNLPAIAPDLDPDAAVAATITRNHLEEMTADLVDRTIDIFKRLLHDASLDLKDIDDVVMVGGMTRMPLVIRKVKEFYGRAPDLTVNPDEAVAMGAAIHAAGLAGEKILRKRKPAAAAASPEEKTLPGLAAPHLAETMPGTPAAGTIKEPRPRSPEEQAPQSAVLPEDLPMDRRDADSPLPVAKEKGAERQRETPSGVDEFFAAEADQGVTTPGAPRADMIEEPEEVIEEDGVEEAQAAGRPEERHSSFEELSAGLEPEGGPVALDGQGPGACGGEQEARGEDCPVSAGPIVIDQGDDYVEELRPAQGEQGRPQEEPREEEPPAEIPKEEKVPQPVLLDVLSHSVGIAHFGGHFVPIIKRFAKLPARAAQVFTTCADSQERIRIKVMQGEGRYVDENTPLGEFVLGGIEKARRGVPEIEVAFDIDQSGLFRVSAKDVKTGAEKEIRIENWVPGEEGAQEEAGDAV